MSIACAHFIRMKIRAAKEESASAMRSTSNKETPKMRRSTIVLLTRPLSPPRASLKWKTSPSPATSTTPKRTSAAAAHIERKLWASSTSSTTHASTHPAHHVQQDLRVDLHATGHTTHSTWEAAAAESLGRVDKVRA